MEKSKLRIILKKGCLTCISSIGCSWLCSAILQLLIITKRLRNKDIAYGIIEEKGLISNEIMLIAKVINI